MIGSVFGDTFGAIVSILLVVVAALVRTIMSLRERVARIEEWIRQDERGHDFRDS